MRQRGFAPIIILIILVVVTLVGIAYLAGTKNPAKVNHNSSSASTAPNPTPNPLTSENSDLCPTNLDIPSGYKIQSPINSFFGITLKNGEGEVCTVLLGPDYDANLKNNKAVESYIGEQIQINAYSKNKTTVEKIFAADSGYRAAGIEYTRNSFGGFDRVALIDSKKAIYQIIWRDESSNQAASEIEKQLQ